MNSKSDYGKAQKESLENPSESCAMAHGAILQEMEKVVKDGSYLSRSRSDIVQSK